VPGCGRGHEAALLAELGYEAIGLDFSSEAIQRAQAVQGSDRTQLRWLQADLFDGAALAAAGITTGSLQGVLEHTCFCAIDPAQREAYLDTVARLLARGGWLLGLFWCHPRPDGPPWGSDPALLAQGLSRFRSVSPAAARTPAPPRSTPGPMQHCDAETAGSGRSHRGAGWRHQRCGNR